MTQILYFLVIDLHTEMANFIVFVVIVFVCVTVNMTNAQGETTL